MVYYLNNFFLFSIFGFFLETIMFAIIDLHNQSGFLHLIWTPFYGIGVLVSILLFNIVKKPKIGNIKKVILLGILLFISLTLVEYIGGILLELLFGYSLWSYLHVPLHINKYISIPTSLGWVAFSFLYLYVIRKYSDKIVSKIPRFITISFLIIFIIDNIVTILQVLKFRSLI